MSNALLKIYNYKKRQFDHAFIWKLILVKKYFSAVILQILTTEANSPLLDDLVVDVFKTESAKINKTSETSDLITTIQAVSSCWVSFRCCYSEVPTVAAIVLY